MTYFVWDVKTLTQSINPAVPPFSSGQPLSNDACLGDKKECYLNCSVTYYVSQLCTMM